MKANMSARLAVLHNLATGKPPGDHLKTATEHRGLAFTLSTLLRDRWINSDLALTERGRAAYAQRAYRLRRTSGGNP